MKCVRSTCLWGYFYGTFFWSQGVPLLYIVIYMYVNDVGVKRYLDSMIPTDCYELCALVILKHSKSAPNGYFLMFCGSQSHTFSCEHEKYDLLPMVSCKNGNIKSKKQRKNSLHYFDILCYNQLRRLTKPNI